MTDLAYWNLNHFVERIVEGNCCQIYYWMENIAAIYALYLEIGFKGAKYENMKNVIGLYWIVYLII